MKIAILTCGILPIPAVQGGAVENKIDFILEYNNRMKLHNITIYSPWNQKAASHPATLSDVNHYVFIDVSSFKARVARRLYGYFHSGEYYNHFIEYYFEKIYAHLRCHEFDCIVLDNCPGYVCKLARRGHKNLALRLGNDLLNSTTKNNELIFNSLYRIMTCSNYIKERVATIQRDNKIQTLYNGINIKAFLKKEQQIIKRSEIGLSEKDFVIVYSGRVNKDKGVSELIDAMLMLCDKSDIKLMIIGSTFFANATNEDDFVRSLKEKAKKIENKIVFTGFIPYEQMPSYLQLADIAALPSMWEEPFGLTIVEAMAAGLPLITTRSGGIPEICEGVATIVDRDEIVNNLIKAIIDLYEHPEKCKQMSEASVERAKLFDKETFIANFFSAIIPPTNPL